MNLTKKREFEITLVRDKTVPSVQALSINDYRITLQKATGNWETIKKFKCFCSPLDIFPELSEEGGENE